MQHATVPDAAGRELAVQLRNVIPPQSEKAVLLAELGDGYAIPQVSIKHGAPSQEKLIEVTFELAAILEDFWDKHVSPSGVAWIALSLSLDKSGFSLRTHDIPEFGRRSQRDVRARIRAACFDSPTTDNCSSVGFHAALLHNPPMQWTEPASKLHVLRGSARRRLGH